MFEGCLQLHGGAEKNSLYILRCCLSGYCIFILPIVKETQGGIHVGLPTLDFEIPYDLGSGALGG